MKNHSNPATQLSLLATGAAALTGSAHGVVTLFDNGGSGWSFDGTFLDTTETTNTFVTSLDRLGILPAGLLDLSFEVSSRVLTPNPGTPSWFLIASGERDGEASPDQNHTGVGKSILGGGETYAPLDLTNSGAFNKASLNLAGQGVDGYIVFSLYDHANEDAANNSGVYLGWAELEASVTPVLGNDPWSLQIKRIGIENEVNQAIVVGAVPEASSTALLLIGAAGAAARRRRKAA